VKLKPLMISLSALCAATGMTQASLPEFSTALPIQTYDVGENQSATNIIVMNHNKAKQVLLVSLDENKEHSGFAITDMSINISNAEAITHLKSGYLTGANAGFLDNYPIAPDNLAFYTELGFDSGSDAEDFQITAQRLISEATGYLYSQNLIIPFQEGYVAYQISDGYVTVDDTNGSSVDAYYRCEIDTWPQNASVVEHCETIAGFDFPSLASVGSKYMGRTASDKSYGLGMNLNTGASVFVEGKDPVFYYGKSPVLISLKQLNGKDASYIKMYDDDDFATVKSEGFFIPTPEVGPLDNMFTISNGSSVYYSDLGDLQSAKQCKLEYGSFDFTANEQDSSIEVMVANLNEDQEVRVLLENYPNLPNNIEAANIIMQEQFGVEITPTMTNTEFKQIVDDAFLTNYYQEWLVDYHSNLAANSEKYPGEYFHCIDSPKNTDPFKFVSLFGTMAFLGDYIYGNTGRLDSSEGFLALSTYSYDIENGYKLLSGDLANYLLRNVSENYLSVIRSEIIAVNPDFSTYPELPDFYKDLIAQSGSMELVARSMYEDAMQLSILSKLGYLNFGTFASVAGDHSSVLIGERSSGGVDKGMSITGRANKKSYLLLFNDSTDTNENAVEVTINPETLTIDPYTSQTSSFSIDVSGSDIFGLDVSCNLSSASLSITQATYGALFGAQNTMTLPLVADPSFVSGTETLIAPELPLSGAGSFMLADVIAEFTTEDVQVTCAAEVSDENGQLLQVSLTPATIRVDDGVHGGTGAVSGTISIPGVTDLSGVEVVLTIDGRQVTVITDETGAFSFDGLRDGDFTISLASENYVQSCQDANVAEGSAVSLGAIELLAGDINGDGSIDIADFTFMAARYRSSQDDADYDAKADLNKDGVINIQDLAILGSHFGSTQCNPMSAPQ